MPSTHHGFESLVGSSPLGILIHHDFSPRYANAALAELFGYQSADEVCALDNVLALTVADEHARQRAYYAQRIAGGTPPARYEIRCLRRDNSEFWAEIVNNVVPWGDEQCVQTCFTDISDRKFAEQRLAENQGLLRTVIDALPLFVFVKDTASNYIMVNKTMTDFYGLPLERFAATNPLTLPIQSMAERERIVADDRVVFETREPYIQPVVRVTRPDGAETFRYSVKIPLFDDHGQLTGLLGVGEDITERLRVEGVLRRAYDELEQRVEDRTAALRTSEAALRASEMDLRRLAGSLLADQETERRSLSRELHDDLTHRLAVLSLEVGKIESESPEAPECQVDRLKSLQNTISTIASDVQRMSRRLHPSILDDLGLVKALDAECAQFAQREGIGVDFRHVGELDALSRDLALSLYRVAQESLRNIAKHSCTANAVVSLVVEDDFISLNVQDSGIGFDLERMNGKGLGLISMEERARLADGHLVVHSAPGQGTRIEVKIPLQRDDI